MKPGQRIAERSEAALDRLPRFGPTCGINTGDIFHESFRAGGLGNHRRNARDGDIGEGGQQHQDQRLGYLYQVMPPISHEVGERGRRRQQLRDVTRVAHRAHGAGGHSVDQDHPAGVGRKLRSAPKKDRAQVRVRQHRHRYRARGNQCGVEIHTENAVHEFGCGEERHQGPPFCG